MAAMCVTAPMFAGVSSSAVLGPVKPFCGGYYLHDGAEDYSNSCQHDVKQGVAGKTKLGDRRQISNASTAASEHEQDQPETWRSGLPSSAVLGPVEPFCGGYYLRDGPQDLHQSVPPSARAPEPQSVSGVSSSTVLGPVKPFCGGYYLHDGPVTNSSRMRAADV